MKQQLDERTIKLIQLANQLIKDNINPLLNDTYKAIRLAILDAGQPRNQREFNRLEKEIERLYFEESAKHLANLTSELYELSAIEAAFFAGVAKKVIKTEKLDIALKTTASDKLNDYVRRSVIHLHSKSGDRVGVWDEFVSGYQDGATKQVLAVVKGAWQSQIGNVLPSAESVIRQVKIANDNLNRASAERIVRTAVNHFSTQGRKYFIEDNKSAIDREIPIVTFDSRVSDICISIADKYGQKGWPVGESPIGYPGYHYSCRTVIGFLLKGQTELEGTRAAVGGKDGKEAEEEFDKRKENTEGVIKYRGKKDTGYFKPGQIPANKPIAKWLNEQPAWFVRETLGEKRAKEFMAGNLNLANLTDKQLKPRTLESLGIE
jgi:hypothetical protein